MQYAATDFRGFESQNSSACDATMLISFLDDAVSMIPKGTLKEYVLNDEGFLFSGYWRWPSPRPWAFAQVCEFTTNINKPEDQWSCKRSPVILAK